MKPVLPALALLTTSACILVDPVCETAETRCMNDVLEICGDDEWTPLNDCTMNGLVCRDLNGNPTCTDESMTMRPDAGPRPVCTPAESRCEGNVLERCAGNGLEWGVDTDCNARGQTCVTAGNEPCVPTRCTRGVDPDFRCTPMGVSQICAGAYSTYTDCAALGGVCANDGLCFWAGACTDREERCTDNRLERCTGDGWKLRENCSVTSQTCNAMGEGRCEGPRTCITGEVQCNQGRVETCADGAFTVTDDCDAQGQECRDNQCVDVACRSGTVTCDGDIASICEAGMWFERDCAAEGQVCSPAGSRPCRDMCIENTGRCRGNTYESCMNGAFVTAPDCSGCSYDDDGNAICG